MAFLIVGLGNVGPQYAKTRHNVGFMIVETLALRHNAMWSENRYGSTANVRIKNQTATLLRPNTLMNLSGNAVKYWMQKEKIELPNLLIAVDDLAIPFGAIRLRPSGAPGSHNGLKNICEQLGTEQYARLRFGLGDDFERGRQIDYVLGKFTQEQETLLPELLDNATDAIEKYILEGIQSAMNAFNTARKAKG